MTIVFHYILIMSFWFDVVMMGLSILCLCHISRYYITKGQSLCAKNQLAYLNLEQWITSRNKSEDLVSYYQFAKNWAHKRGIFLPGILLVRDGIFKILIWLENYFFPLFIYSSIASSPCGNRNGCVMNAYRSKPLPQYV